MATFSLCDTSSNILYHGAPTKAPLFLAVFLFACRAVASAKAGAVRAIYLVISQENPTVCQIQI